MAPKAANPRGRGRGRASAAEKGKRKAPPSNSSSSSSSPSPSPQRPARPRGPGIQIREGNEVTTEVPVFRNEQDKDRFNTAFEDRRLTKDNSIDFGFFNSEEFEFPNWLRNFGLETFLSQKEELYGRLVKMFYFYLDYEMSTTNCKSFVNGVQLEFNLRGFCEVMQLPFDLEDEAEDVSISQKIKFLTGRNNLPEAAFFARELKSIDLRILFNIVCNCLYPRAGGFDKVTIDDIELLYGIVTGNKMSLAHMMMQYMVQQKNRSNGHLPFGRSLTRLFKHFKVDLTKEKPKKFTSYYLISDSTLKRMRIFKEDGIWKEKGREQIPEEADQAEAEVEAEADGPADVPDFDHFPIDDLIGNPQPSSDPYTFT